MSKEKQHNGTRRGINVVEAPKGPYDAILLNQVLEHLPDPVALLRLLRDHLSEGGVIFAATPNGTPVCRTAKSFRERDFLTYQKIVAPLEHLNVFTFQTPVQTGKSAGLKASRRPHESLSRTTAAQLKGRLMEQVGLSRKMAAEVIFGRAE